MLSIRDIATCTPKHIPAKSPCSPHSVTHLTLCALQNISSSTAIAVLNAQRALLGPIEGISSEVEPAQEDLCGRYCV